MNKDAKRLLENFISIYSIQIVGMVLPLITLPYVIKTLGFDNYGLIILASSLIAYFQSITDFSFRITATRDVAVFRDSPKKLNLIYSKVLTIKAIFLLVSFALLTIIVLVYPPFYKERLVFFLTMPMLLGYTLFPEWYFQGIEKMRYITLLNFSLKIFFTICVFIFIKNKSDYWIYPLLQSAGSVGVGIVAQFILIKKHKLKFIWLPLRIIKRTIATNFPIFLTQFLPTLYNNTTTFLLGIMTTNSLLGIYSAIYTVVDISITFLRTISLVFFPFLNRKKEAFQKYKKLIFSLSFILFFGCIIFHPFVFWFLNITYENALLVLCILSFGILGIGMNDIFGTNYFIIKRADKLVMYNTIIASVLGLIFSFPLVYFFGIIGAALNLTFSRLLMGGRLYYKYLSVKKEPLLKSYGGL
jgi:PST family polysaccharide transporter